LPAPFARTITLTSFVRALGLLEVLEALHKYKLLPTLLTCR
jgi:hypothetical protein